MAVLLHCDTAIFLKTLLPDQLSEFQHAILVLTGNMSNLWEFLISIN